MVYHSLSPYTHSLLNYLSPSLHFSLTHPFSFRNIFSPILDIYPSSSHSHSLSLSLLFLSPTISLSPYLPFSLTHTFSIRNIFSPILDIYPPSSHSLSFSLLLLSPTISPSLPFSLTPTHTHTFSLLRNQYFPTHIGYTVSMKLNHTVYQLSAIMCPRILDPFDIVTYHIE